MNWTHEFIGRLCATGTLQASHFRILIPIYELPKHVFVKRAVVSKGHILVDGGFYTHVMELPTPPIGITNDVFPERKNEILK